MVGTRTRRRKPAPVSESLQGLGERLRRARLDAGLSQAQLGQPHFTRAYLSAIELGKVRPSMKSLEFLAAKLGKPPSFFMEDEAEEQRRRERAARLARASQLIEEGRARDALEGLAPLLAESRAPSERAPVLRALGRAHWEVGENTKAAVILSDALTIYRAANDREGIIRTEVQLGSALFALMSAAEALALWNDALASITRGELKDPLLKVHVLHNIGLIHFHDGDYALALRHFERAELEGSDIADPKWLATLYAAIGMSRHQVRDFEGAIICLWKSEALFESINNRARVAETRLQRARTLREMGHLSRSREALDQAEALAAVADNQALRLRISQTAATYMVRDGETAAGMDRLLDCVRQADVLGEPYLRFQTRLVCGRELAALDPKAAEAVLREAAELIGEGERVPELAEVYRELSDVLALRGLSEEALAYSQKAVRMVSPR